MGIFPLPEFYPPGWQQDSRRGRQLGCASGAVPEPGDFHNLRLVVDAINDAVRLEDDFANRRRIKLRHDPSHLWKLGEYLRLGDERQTKGLGGGGIVRRDVTHRLLEILDGARGEDYV